MSTNSNTYNPEELKQQILTAIENPTHDKRSDYSVCGYRNGYIDTPSKEPKKDEVPETPRDIEKQVDIRERKLKISDFDAVGFYTFGTNNITMNKYNYTVKDFKGLISKEELQDAQNYLDNPFLKNKTLFHEINHYQDYQINGMSDIQTPIDIARSNRFTETKSHAVGYLSTAMTYTFHKNQGIKTIEMAGKEVPLENILTTCPGLDEILKDKDFDPNNPEMVRRIVEASSKYWHEDEKVQETYEQQAIDTALSVDYETTYQSDLKRAKDPRTDEQIYDDFVTKALQNVYIGTNTCVDLSNCRDLLDTMSIEEAKNLTGWPQSEYDYNKSITPSKETLLAVDGYLESIGITNEKEKAKYLKTQIDYIASRNPNCDSQLKSIITQHGGEITYKDGITEIYDENGKRTTLAYNGATFDVSEPSAEPIIPDRQSLKQDITNDSLSAQATIATLSTDLTQESSPSNPDRATLKQEMHNDANSGAIETTNNTASTQPAPTIEAKSEVSAKDCSKNTTLTPQQIAQMAAAHSR